MSQGLLRHPAAQFALLLLAAVALRWDTFGDPNLHGDEVFYFTVGEAMHHGALPYVDVWDRKPFGLFAIYWLIAGISTAPLAYQLAACLSAAGTALAIGGIARRWTTPLGGLLAGLCYLLWLKPLQGFGGQAPIFYNLPVACAALLVLRGLPALREGRAPASVAGAMLLGGLAIAVKTSALFESAFFGLYAATALLRSPMPTVRALRVAAGWALLGALPTLLIAGFYWADGHWAEFWHAMVVSNLAKQTYWEWVRLTILFLFLSPILLLAVFGLLDQEKDSRRFVLLWLVAAMAGLCAVPNFYLHYGLPLLVPFCAAAAGFLGRAKVGLPATAVVAAIALWIEPYQVGHAQRSARAMAALETAVRQHVGKGPLLLYDAPPQLYQLTGQPFITPLVFPTHLSHGIEKDVSHLSTLGETKRVLALKPGAVVMAVPPRNGPVNEETHKLVLAYVGRSCRLITVVPTLEWQRTDMIAVWGDCREPPTNISADQAQIAIMDEIEAKLRVPAGSEPWERYARFYSFAPGNKVKAIFHLGDNNLPLRWVDGDGRRVPPPPPSLLENDENTRQWVTSPDKLPKVADGGCGFIHFEFDLMTKMITSLGCNGNA